MRGEQLAKVSNDLGLLGGEVFGLGGIGLVVVEFENGSLGCCTRLFPFDETMSRGADGAADEALLAGEGVDEVGSRCCGRDGAHLWERVGLLFSWLGAFRELGRGGVGW